MKNVLTVCPWCGCGCGIYLKVDTRRPRGQSPKSGTVPFHSEITGVAPVEGHPVSDCRLCIKGWNAFEYVQHADRLTKPLLRKKRTDEFKSVSWKEALSFIAVRLKQIKEKYGPDSIAFLSSAKCTNEENYLMQKFARAVTGTNNIDHCARLCHSPTITGLGYAFGSAAMTNSISEIEGAQLYFVTGTNVTEQFPEVAGRIIKNVNRGNAKLIVVDPRRIKLSDFATIYLQPKPGTDVIWINGMAKIIIDESLADNSFITGHTEGFDAFKSSLEKFSPQYVERETGIPADKLAEAARLYAKTQKAMLFYAMGITQHSCGTDNVKALANLVMMTGHIGFPSSGLLPIRGQNNVQGACDMGALPDFLPGYQKISDSSARAKFEKAWKVKLPETPGLVETEMFSSDKLRAMYIMGENPALCEPNLNNVKKFLALGRLECIVVQDIFLTETAKFADVILPAASFAEKDGTFTNCERRIQRVRKAIEPVGKSKADWEIICELSKMMGHEMKYSSPSEIMDEASSLTPIYGGVNYARLESIDGLQWPCPSAEHPGTQYLHKGGNFSRGKGRFSPVGYKPPKEPADAEFPFTLTTGRLYEHWHTSEMTGRISTLQREQPKPFVEINPVDADELKIKNLSEVRVTSRRGYITLQAKFSERVPQKTVFIPFHYARAPANMLTIDALDPESKIPEFKIAAVKIEKIT